MRHICFQLSRSRLKVPQSWKLHVPTKSDLKRQGYPHYKYLIMWFLFYWVQRYENVHVMAIIEYLTRQFTYIISNTIELTPTAKANPWIAVYILSRASKLQPWIWSHLCDSWVQLRQFIRLSIEWISCNCDGWGGESEREKGYEKNKQVLSWFQRSDWNQICRSKWFIGPRIVNKTESRCWTRDVVESSWLGYQRIRFVHNSLDNERQWRYAIQPYKKSLTSKKRKIFAANNIVHLTSASLSVHYPATACRWAFILTYHQAMLAEDNQRQE